MGLTLLSLLVVALMSLSLGMLYGVWLGLGAAGVFFLLMWPLERWLDIPLRMGKFSLAWLAPLVWLGAAGGYFFVGLNSSDLKEREAAFKPLRAEVEAVASVNKTQLQVEKDRLIYTLVIRYKKGLKPKIPKITAHPTFNSTFVMPADKPPIIKFLPEKKGIITKKWVITLVPVSTGPLDTPKFVIRYRKGGKWKKVIVPKIAIEVSGLKHPSKLLTELVGAKGPILPERPSDRHSLILLSLFFGLLVMSLGGLLWLRHRQQQEKPPIPPHEWIEEELKKLKRLGYLRKGEFKAHYFTLSEIFRGYLARRYDFPALENTTEEIIQWCKENSEIKQDIFRDIKQLLQWMDAIKFAGDLPSEEEIEEMDKRLQSVVRRTRVLPEMTQDEEKKGA